MHANSKSMEIYLDTRYCENPYYIEYSYFLLLVIFLQLYN